MIVTGPPGSDAVGSADVGSDAVSEDPGVSDRCVSEPELAEQPADASSTAITTADSRMRAGVPLRGVMAILSVGGPDRRKWTGPPEASGARGGRS
jgi:hypothetical protein